jgi:hypothetical protein
MANPGRRRSCPRIPNRPPDFEDVYRTVPYSLLQKIGPVPTDGVALPASESPVARDEPR